MQCSITLARYLIVTFSWIGCSLNGRLRIGLVESVVLAATCRVGMATVVALVFNKVQAVTISGTTFVLIGVKAISCWQVTSACVRAIINRIHTAVVCQQ